MNVQLHIDINAWLESHPMSDKDAAEALGLYQSHFSTYRGAGNRGVLENERGEFMTILPKHFAFYEDQR